MRQVVALLIKFYTKYIIINTSFILITQSTALYIVMLLYMTHILSY